MALELRVLEAISEVGEATWNGLLHPGSSPFVEYAWLDSLEKAGCVGEKAGWIPRHLVLYDGKDVIAATPAYLKTNSEG